MNGYVLEYGGKRYATNADNSMEAEDKLFTFLGDIDLGKSCKIIQVESLDSLRADTEVIFF